MALRTFHTQFTQVSRHSWASNRKQKKCLGKTVLKIWSLICGKMASFVHKTTLKKKSVFEKWLYLSIKQLWKKIHFFFKVILWTNEAIFLQIWNHIFRTVFPKNCFCFLFEAQECLETCVNCVWNVRNAHFYPPWGPNFKKYFFQTSTPPSSEMLDLYGRWHLQDFFWENLGFEKSRSSKSQFSIMKVCISVCEKFCWNRLCCGEMNIDLTQKVWSLTR